MMPTDGLTKMSVSVAAEQAPAPVADPKAIDIARKREALTAKRSPNIAGFNDEEIELLWGSLSEADRRAYLRDPDPAPAN